MKRTTWGHYSTPMVEENLSTGPCDYVTLCFYPFLLCFFMNYISSFPHSPPAAMHIYMSLSVGETQWGKLGGKPPLEEISYTQYYQKTGKVKESEDTMQNRDICK